MNKLEFKKEKSKKWKVWIKKMKGRMKKIVKKKLNQKNEK